MSASAEEASFTTVADLDVDSRGLIYVPDTYQQRVTVLRPDGTVLRSFGRRGGGPDEFRAIRGVQVLPGDSVLVYDPTLGRISVFAPDSGRAAYTVALGARLPGPSPFTVRRTTDNGALVALFRPGFQFREGADFSNRRDRVRVLERDGALRVELVAFPSRAFLVAGTSITPHPFGREGFARVDSRNRVHYAWSDSVGVESYGLDGTRAGGFRHPFVPPAITRADVDAAVEDMNPQVRAEFQPVLADSLPERWPAVRGMLVDDRDRIWILLGGNARQPSEWAAFATDGGYLGSMLVPAGSNVRLIRGDGTVYAERVDENDVPQVVVYRMARRLR